MRAVVALVLLSAAALLPALRASAQGGDLAGWDKARWGMTMDELGAAFGPRLKKLPAPIYYRDSFAIQVVDDVTLGGVRFIALFQMDPGAGRLVQVLLRAKGATPTHTSYVDVLKALESTLGPPAKSERKTDYAGDIPWFRVVDRWTLPTTSVVLTYYNPDFAATLDRDLHVGQRRAFFPRHRQIFRQSVIALRAMGHKVGGMEAGILFELSLAEYFLKERPRHGLVFLLLACWLSLTGKSHGND